ncbi:mechanosensitive ion channel domain-containing protein [Sulfitobacter sp. LCG007]
MLNRAMGTIFRQILTRSRHPGGVLVLAALSFCLLVAQADAQTDAPPQAGEPAISVGSSGEDDQRIGNRIGGIFSEIDGLGSVAVSVRAGVVTLAGTVAEPAQIEQAADLARRVEGVVSVRNRVELDDSVSAQIDPAVERILGRATRILSLAPLAVFALIVFAVVLVIGLLLTRDAGIWRRIAPNPFIADIYRVLARVSFVIVAIVLALDVLDATALIGAVLGVAGVAGLAVGFAVRDTVENFIASILLSLRQPFRPNDLVEIEGMLGHVARLTSRATVLISPDGNHIRIPNATVFKGMIVNYTRQPERRFVFSLGVDADADLGQALRVAVEAVQALPFVLERPAMSAWIAEVGDSNVLLTFAGWVNQSETEFDKGRGEAIRAAKTALEAAGFGLPEPIYRLKMDSPAGPAREERPGATVAAPRGNSTPPDAARPENRDTAPSEAATQERVSMGKAGDLLSRNPVSE